MTESAGVAYGYEDAGHAHAVTDLDGVEKFQYDANGNMISRIMGTKAYEQAFDVENRLAAVTDTDTLQVTLFSYDAAGQRVKTERPDVDHLSPRKVRGTTKSARAARDGRV